MDVHNYLSMYGVWSAHYSVVAQCCHISSSAFSIVGRGYLHMTSCRAIVYLYLSATKMAYCHIPPLYRALSGLDQASAGFSRMEAKAFEGFSPGDLLRVPLHMYAVYTALDLCISSTTPANGAGVPLRPQVRTSICDSNLICNPVMVISSLTTRKRVFFPALF